jgi:hypothetical protein
MQILDGAGMNISGLDGLAEKVEIVSGGGGRDGDGAGGGEIDL